MQTVHPITAAELVEFRELLFGATIEGVVAQRQAMGEALGLDPITLWRGESGQTIQHGIIMRRALVQLADELALTSKVHVPKRLRTGLAPVPAKAKARSAGAGRR